MERGNGPEALSEPAALKRLKAALWEKEDEVVFSGGLIAFPDGIKKGHLVVRGGLIEDMGPGPSGRPAVDLEGDMLMAGLIELHTDNLERHLRPRPGVYWPEPGSAVLAHDAQLISCGITTVFDSICLGETMDLRRRALAELSIAGLDETKGHLRADHKLHFRCEISDPMMGEMLESLSDREELSLVSVMDHAPGQRQWRSMDAFKLYHGGKAIEEADVNGDVDRIMKERERHGSRHVAMAAMLAKKRGIPLASHDDTTVEHILEALASGAAISEFPTTMEAARAARLAGLDVTMGAPNLVRGRSHSENVSAREVAEEGLLSSLSSDYAPASLISGAYILCKECGYSLSEALKTVTLNPARMGLIADRGLIEPGLRADLVRIATVAGHPVVRSVWAAGKRVF
jgi:alpha-D-ribose 1-methylphosphonate 5-triphosphate diphosphatase